MRADCGNAQRSVEIAGKCGRGLTTVTAPKAGPVSRGAALGKLCDETVRITGTLAIGPENETVNAAVAQQLSRDRPGDGRAAGHSTKLFIEATSLRCIVTGYFPGSAGYSGATSNIIAVILGNPKLQKYWKITFWCAYHVTW